MTRTAFLKPLALALLFLAVFLVYRPGLSGGFLFDDGTNIVENEKLHITEFSGSGLASAILSSDAGPLRRPVAMFSFALNHLAGGLDPYGYKLANLILHLGTGAAVFWLSWLLLRTHAERFRTGEDSARCFWSALLISAAWMLHPLNLSSVLYVVQRMASLAAFFTLLAVGAYLAGRRRQLAGGKGFPLIFLGIAVFGSLAVFSKENALLFPAYLFLVEWLVLGFRAESAATRRRVVALNLALAVIPALLVLGYLASHVDWLAGMYGNRDFTLAQRLLTESRVLWFYVGLILLPDIRRMGLYHDDFPVSTGLLAPPATLAAILALATAFALAIAVRKRAPLLSLGILWFFLGHAMESTVFPLELVHEHRNYLPALGLLLPACYYLAAASRLPGLRIAAPALAVVLVAALGAGTAIRAEYWSNDLDLALVDAAHHPGSKRTNSEAGRILFALAEAEKKLGAPEHRVAARREESRNYFRKAAAIRDSNLQAEFALLMIDDREGKAPDAALVEDIAARLSVPPLAASSTNGVIRLSRCQTAKICRFPPEVLDKLYTALLKNPGLNATTRGTVLAEISQNALARGDLDDALDSAEAAIYYRPTEGQLYINYAHLLIVAGDFENAGKLLDQAGKLDWDGFLRKNIEEQERLLLKVKAENPAP